MLDFTKYPSVSNDVPQESPLEMRFQWVACPKIHGTNVQVCFFREDTSQPFARAYGRRNAYLKDDESHYGTRELLDKALLADDVGLTFPRAKSVVIYGETFGGTYPHPDVPPDPTAKPVQRRPYYSPHICFNAFDLKVDGEFLHFDEAQDLLDSLELRVLVPAYRGTFQGAIAYAKEHAADIVSPTPRTLPSIADNQGEGFVVRPVVEMTDRRGARCLYKIKNPRFEEIATGGRAKPKPEVAPATATIIAAYVNTPRIEAVLSKESEADVSLTNIASLGHKLYEDVIGDLPPGTSLDVIASKQLRGACFRALKLYLSEAMRGPT